MRHTGDFVFMRHLQPWRRLHFSCGCGSYQRIGPSWQPLYAQRPNNCSAYLLSSQSRGSTGPNDDGSNTSVHRDGSENRSDHRTIGTIQGLWTQHHSSPGSPFFLPAGAHLFQKLVEFLRAQYPAYGFQEVLTPTLYKQSLWEQSGHWANYKDDMFTVKGGSMSEVEKEAYSLKPMNCPGHCLLFASKRRSYRDLPIRYADFSPLHRDEISGALSGLTRVRRLHQDDGHIFCLPDQIQKEVKDQLQFIDMVYGVFGLKIYKILLSTRPESYIGDLADWESAERQLKEALEQSRMEWSLNPGDGAFYGPKIDVIIKDSDEKEHQTATVQLDFQLPKRFKLAYADGEQTANEQSVDGRSEPVMIHRAIFGSLERFIALLTEHYNGRWPFWLSPNQVIILTVSDNLNIVKYAETVAALIRNAAPQVRRKLNSPTYSVDVDSSGDSIGKKIARAKDTAGNRYPLLCVLGQKNVDGNYLDLDISGMRDQVQIGNEIDKCLSDSQMPTSKKTEHRNGKSSIRIEPTTLIEVMKKWTDSYI